MTSLACFVLAGLLLVATSSNGIAQKRRLVYALTIIVLALASDVLFFDVGGGLITAIGRDPTLTGRTELWGEVLSVAGNPLIGTGFESFWQGSRLEKLWSIHWWHPNQAHNGYLELFLNLGWIGLVLLAVIIFTGYRRAIRGITHHDETAGLRLAFVVVAVIYSFTEAGFRLMSPAWIGLMLASAFVPALSSEAIASSAAEETAISASRGFVERFDKPSLDHV